MTYYQLHREKMIAYAAKRNKGVKTTIKKFIAELKDKPCKDCGIKYNPWVMDFDHRNPKEKLYKISNLISINAKLETIENEAAKCDVVCSNCHRERTHKQGFI